MKTARFCNNDEKGPPPLKKKTDFERKRGKFPPFFLKIPSGLCSIVTSDELPFSLLSTVPRVIYSSHLL